MVQPHWFTVNVHSSYEHAVVHSALIQASTCAERRLQFIWAQARDIDWTSVLAGRSLASACPLFYGDLPLPSTSVALL
jgi:hypothetical protein